MEMAEKGVLKMDTFMIDDYIMKKSADCSMDEYNEYPVDDLDVPDELDDEFKVYMMDEYTGNKAIIMPIDEYNGAPTVTIEKGHVLKTPSETEYMLWLKKCKTGIDHFLKETDKGNRLFVNDSCIDYQCMILKNNGEGFKIVNLEVLEQCLTCNIVLDYEVMKRLFAFIYSRQNTEFVEKLYNSGRTIGDLYYEAIISDDVDSIIELETECGFPKVDDFDLSPDPFIRSIVNECERFHSEKILEYFKCIENHY